MGAAERPLHPGFPSEACIARLPPPAEALRLSQSAGLALFSLATNRVLAEQIRSAHAWGEFLREQSAALAAVGARAGDRAIGEVLTIAARIGAHAGESIVEAALEGGRRYGHLAFAVPLTTCSEA
jgi:hypothetical protein